MQFRLNLLHPKLYGDVQVSPKVLLVLWLTLGLMTYLYALLPLLTPRILLVTYYFT